MRLLVVGGGGREHALVWKLSQSPKVQKLYAIPGNGGVAELAECGPDISTDPAALVAFARARKIDFTVIGPEAPLVAGVVDAFERAGLAIFGPNRRAAQLEGSKSFAKETMQKYGVPTGEAAVFSAYADALDYLKGRTPPYVIKADGLASGKGVIIAGNLEQGTAGLQDCFVAQKFGRAGTKVLIEEHLEGEELSLLAFTDGQTVVPMVPAQDYKRVYDGDLGPNTGGMGSYSPVPAADESLCRRVVADVIEPTVKGLASEGITYRGVLYAGLILTAAGPKVLEFNARFGDPETQAILPRLESDLLEVMLAVSAGKLSGLQLRWSPKRAVTVVLAAAGYPERPGTGQEIQGLAAAGSLDDVHVFHAGTTLDEAGRTLTAGGRVLSVTGLGPTFSAARDRAYEAAERIYFEGMHYRTDIGERAVKIEQNAGLARSFARGARSG